MMQSPPVRPRFLTGGMLAVLPIALAKLTLHVIVNGRYGYFRDEFDYLACGDHLAWGYVDQPPLVPFLMKITRLILGSRCAASGFFRRWPRPGLW